MSDTRNAVSGPHAVRTAVLLADGCHSPYCECEQCAEPDIAHKRFTHALQYQQPDGSWRDGFLGYTLSEARGVARAGRERTGRAVRIVKVRDA